MSPQAESTHMKHVVCTICDIGCQFRAEAKDGRLARILPHENPLLASNICFKGVAAPHIHNHEERLRKPLKRVGERGQDQWEEISYGQAMDEIAERLSAIVQKHGPESFAASTSGWNTQTTHSMDRRFMNLLGSPNWISGVSLCAGNTAAVNRMTYGWFPQPDFINTKCIVLFGHNPRKHSWTPIYNMINFARAQGAKVIVLDPRISDQAEVAALHLRLRAGTDAAMCLGWLKVIFDEKLYDEDFVRDWCVGFEELKGRVDEYPLERVDLFVINEIEGRQLTGRDAPTDILDTMCERYGEAATVLTLGGNGAMYRDPRGSCAVEAAPVEVRDSTAAGDTFTGYFLAEIFRDSTPLDALARANKAASICVTRPGAATSIPLASELAG